MAQPRKMLQRLPRRKFMAWGIFMLVFSMIALPLGLSFYSQTGFAVEAQEQENPRANYWRAVREGNSGSTSVQGQESSVLIQNGGQNWRQMRNGWLIPYSGYLLIAILVLFALYFTIKGRIRIEEGRSGREYTRTTSAERWVHWFTAVVFVLMALTGLILLYGRTVLIPVMGPEAFAATAELSKIVHNYLGILFILAIVLTIIIFLRDSLFNMQVDMKWFMTAGGYLGGRHPSAEKYNAGQKAWYWTAAIMGVILCVTGLILNFPNFEQTRETMQIANIIHVIASAIVIAFLLVHVYLALSTEGALQAMTTGKVDENWVKQHHDLWYEQLRQSGQETTPAPAGSASGESTAVPREQPS